MALDRDFDEHPATVDELVAGHIWYAVRALNALILDAAVKGVRTEICVAPHTERVAIGGGPFRAVETIHLHGQCYRREDIHAVRQWDTEAVPVGEHEAAIDARFPVPAKG